MKDRDRQVITISRTADRAAPLAGGEDAAFEAAFAAHWPWVCRTLYRLVGDWDDAEDLALEVFWRLRRRPPRDQERVASWLYRVATNLGLNALRAGRRRVRYEVEASQVELQSRSDENPEAVALRRETQERVRATLRALRPRSARLLLLRYSGLSYAEIAETLALSPGSVGQLLARAEREFELRFGALEVEDATSE
jgi:RNA polymerase sigma-70 factor (ECF subfamily)